MSKQIDALKLALEALDIVKIHYTQNRHVKEAITAIKEALAQEQEHFALKHRIAELEGAVIGLQAQLAQPEQERPAPCAKHCEATALQITIKNLEAQLAKRTWVGLTDDEIEVCYSEAYKIVQGRRLEFAFYQVIEAKLKEKNTRNKHLTSSN